MKATNAIAVLALLAASSCFSNSENTNQVSTGTGIKESTTEPQNVVRTSTHKFTFKYLKHDFKKPLAAERYEEEHGLSDQDSIVTFHISVSCVGSSINPLKNNVSGLSEYNDRLAYMLDRAGAEFLLSYGQYALSPAFYHFENNYGGTPYDKMIVGFKIPDAYPTQDMTIEYEDQLYGNGIVKSKFNSNNL